jgi:hypothetical protein
LCFVLREDDLLLKLELLEGELELEDELLLRLELNCLLCLRCLDLCLRLWCLEFFLYSSSALLCFFK